jgi:hypothetical protein
MNADDQVDERTCSMRVSGLVSDSCGTTQSRDSKSMARSSCLFPSYGPEIRTSGVIMKRLWSFSWTIPSET